MWSPFRGYRLKDSDPAEATALFRKVLTRTAPSTEYHQKAEGRLAELGAKP